MVVADGIGGSTSCYRLVDEALNAGGKGNVTVVVARYRLPRPQAAGK